MSDNSLYFTIHIVSMTFIFYPSEHINSLDAVEDIRFSCNSLFSNYEDEVSSKCSCWLTTHTSSPPSSTRVQLPDSGPDATELWLSHGFRCPRNSARCLFQKHERLVRYKSLLYYIWPALSLIMKKINNWNSNVYTSFCSPCRRH